jgi:hypothetical protein
MSIILNSCLLYDFFIKHKNKKRVPPQNNGTNTLRVATQIADISAAQEFCKGNHPAPLGARSGSGKRACLSALTDRGLSGKTDISHILPSLQYHYTPNRAKKQELF